MNSLFSKGTGTALFSKGGSALSTLFRKSYNTLDKIGKGVSQVGNISSKLAPIVTPYSPLIGGVASTIAGISPLIRGTLDNVVKNSKTIKNSIEKSRPIKQEQETMLS